MSDNQSDGRKANAAQPLGERSGLVSEEGRDRTARKEQNSAGPDGPDPDVVGDSLKSKPGR